MQSLAPAAALAAGPLECAIVFPGLVVFDNSPANDMPCARLRDGQDNCSETAQFLHRDVAKRRRKAKSPLSFH
jgi:hypothetical protein